MRVTDKKELVYDGVYTTSPGCFGTLIKDQIKWWGCREQFHTYVDPQRLGNYFFTHPPGQTDNIADFISYVENHFKIDRSNFMYTDKPTLMWVEASPWWLESAMKHSFYTICLRAGMNWYRDGKRRWDEVLHGHPYLAATRFATQRFLDGFTEYTGNIRGWRQQFEGKGEDTVSNLLVAPEEPHIKHDKISKIAYDLWEKNERPCGCDHIFWTAAIEKYRTKLVEVK